MNSSNYQLSDSNQKSLESVSSIDKPESSSLSDTSVPTRHSLHSDGAVILASSWPKKRAGRRVFKETRHPVYRGVRRRNNNKWVCEVREPNKKTRIWLGTYPTVEMAARAHDVAALALRGKQACLNFADSAWRLPIPASKDQLDIRRAAAEAAETFRPEEFGGVSSSCDDNEIEHENENVEMDNEKNDGFYEEREHENEKKNEDEEPLFDMPRLLTRMAEGPLLSPPRHSLDSMNWADYQVESEANFCLWSF
ncbi:putative transcription factor AP2-EREBP family [Rosa chinensis]|uniref:Putative transcription factor AP2-EREBP family n=1 Tax=Rosa chinensis TaxID=74649 RepID=A0A2P6P7D8_ROSCH|nr:dehydration-responsive element-binding protein 1E [Rosa chinensis]PRQ17839.1 putative transcription factor AP2-EREBP family [Rosa chinensis]